MTAYLLPPLDRWEQLDHDFLIVFNEQCILIDSLMGIHYPGYDEAWVDYDDDLLAS